MLTINGKITELFSDVQVNGSLKLADGSTGGLSIVAAEAAADIAAAATITIHVNVPTGSRLLGCQLRVDAALAATETWDAVYVTGATQSIATNQAVAVNTKVVQHFDVNTDTDIASGEVDITIEKNSNPGVDAFSAQGNIRAIVYYTAFNAMADV
jgi:hypothetical protein